MTKIRKMIFSKMEMTSDVWLATLGLLFGKSRCINGEEVYIRCQERERFYCSNCDSDFSSFLTPVICPNCKAKPGEDAIILIHKTHTDKIFPFYAPVEIHNE